MDEKKVRIIWWCDYCRKWGICYELSDWTATMTNINNVHRNSTPDCDGSIQNAAAIGGMTTTQDVLRAVDFYDRVR